MNTAHNVAIYRRWFDEGWSRGNVDVADELYASNYVTHSLPPDFATDLNGLKAFVCALRGGMPDLRFTIEDVVAAGDRVAGRLTGRGTHTGTLLGIPPSGKQAVISCMVFARFDEAGKWAEDWANWDQLGMLRQIGVIPELVTA